MERRRLRSWSCGPTSVERRRLSTWCTKKCMRLSARSAGPDRSRYCTAERADGCFFNTARRSSVRRCHMPCTQTSGTSACSACSRPCRASHIRTYQTCATRHEPKNTPMGLRSSPRPRSSPIHQLSRAHQHGCPAIPRGNLKQHKMLLSANLLDEAVESTGRRVSTCWLICIQLLFYLQHRDSQPRCGQQRAQCA